MPEITRGNAAGHGRPPAGTMLPVALSGLISQRSDYPIYVAWAGQAGESKKMQTARIHPENRLQNAFNYLYSKISRQSNGLFQYVNYFCITLPDKY
jgi:hypothetical protein